MVEIRTRVAPHLAFVDVNDGGVTGHFKAALQFEFDGTIAK